MMMIVIRRGMRGVWPNVSRFCVCDCVVVVFEVRERERDRDALDGVKRGLTSLDEIAACV